MDEENLLCEAEKNKDISTFNDLPIGLANPKENYADQQNGFHKAGWEVHNEITNMFLKRDASIGEVDSTRQTQNGIIEKYEKKGTYEVLSSNGSKKKFTGVHEQGSLRMKASDGGNNFKDHGSRETRFWFKSNNRTVRESATATLLPQRLVQLSFAPPSDHHWMHATRTSINGYFTPPGAM
ncbi:hypothetical protein B296_00035244 [Ensete ventricosum]|uniref:Uncharacterized protein n=1 Tax=Ensete ventricosum TaxID=4639 RepID=A0A426ZQD8_ENSVE|nr:hypothetical protein B296_00035244 [Ensete ventricosum]